MWVYQGRVTVTALVLPLGDFFQCCRLDLVHADAANIEYLLNRVVTSHHDIVMLRQQRGRQCTTCC